ncbi:hypothetical protein AQ490_07680 [Wenjunlia vitaminophila]|uniref:DUF881 domain-containing protein n=1 Tax=Wenjunlia vitaminophila TaxID=76728 RepID=A0A0T6LMM8_WENVI|nr:DUF881 domain-containing protein [Wenjunlia vitaminophila]KRV47335.1 hypothetical protein AQ490_07680 [Wenjunlia vitaminophila]
MSPSLRSLAGQVPRLLSAGVFALAGLLFWVSFDTAQGTNLRTDDSLLRLSDLIGQRSDRNAELDEDLSALHKQVDRRNREENGHPAATRQLDRLRDAAGTKPVRGPAVTVTLTDAPPDARPRIPEVPEPSPNDLVIHQQDLQAVVNALWRGGATGIRVMDQRLISTSAVRCVGNTLILQGRVYSPPYTVTAVGDRDRLRAALDDDPAIENYLQYVEAYGLGWKVEEHGMVTLRGYSGTVDLRHAEPLAE